MADKINFLDGRVLTVKFIIIIFLKGPVLLFLPNYGHPNKFSVKKIKRNQSRVFSVILGQG